MPSHIDDIVQKIRRQLENEAKAAPVAPGAGDGDALPALRVRPGLAYLNAHWLLNPEVPIRSHRPLVGPILVGAKKLVRRIVYASGSSRPHVLVELLRFVNALADRSDRLLQELTQRTKAIAERNDVFLGAFDMRLEALEAREQLRATRAAEPVERTASVPEHDALVAEAAVDLTAGVIARVEPLLARFDGSRRVLDVGCGRGEVLEKLVERRISAKGVEASPSLVAECRSRGLEVALAAPLEHLRSLAEGALDGVLVTRTAERFAPAAWPALVAEVWRVLRPEGRALFEGIHGSEQQRWMRWLLARQRFHGVELHACGAGDDHALRSLPSAEAGPEIAVLNENFERLNRIVFEEREHVLFAVRGAEP